MMPAEQISGGIGLNWQDQQAPSGALVPVVLCGGSGTRLWPLSRADQPKPFHTLGQAHSLLQQTLLRLHDAPALRVAPAIVVANEAHRFIAAHQLSEIDAPVRHLVLEPEGRNTAPALTLAALMLQAAGQAQAPMLLTPADHRIADTTAWRAAVGAALPAARSGALVLFGVAPTRAETGYGYVHAPADPAAAADGLRAVRAFVEKPPAFVATRLSADGEHFWNSGMGLMRADVWLRALQRFRPDIVQACRAALQQVSTDGDFVRPSRAPFLACPARSIDHAVLEPLAVAPAADLPLRMGELACGWSDIGAWDAVLDSSPRDADGNAAQGAHLLLDCRDTLVLAGERLVAAVGLEDMLVVDTPDAVLVAHRAAAQRVQALAQSLQAGGSQRWQHSQSGVQRPWGWFDVVGRGSNWVVKRIVVRPGASLSLQRHRHRAEHWTVLRGVAEVQCGERSVRLQRYASTFVPQGQVHRLSNPGADELEVLELQTGDIVHEDDIERLDDRYGRVPSSPVADASPV